jgi:hypothetical protein
MCPPFRWENYPQGVELIKKGAAGGMTAAEIQKTHFANDPILKTITRAQINSKLISLRRTKNKRSSADPVVATDDFKTPENAPKKIKFLATEYDGLSEVDVVLLEGCSDVPKPRRSGVVSAGKQKYIYDFLPRPRSKHRAKLYVLPPTKTGIHLAVVTVEVAPVEYESLEVSVVELETKTTTHSSSNTRRNSNRRALDLTSPVKARGLLCGSKSEVKAFVKQMKAIEDGEKKEHYQCKYKVESPAGALGGKNNVKLLKNPTWLIVRWTSYTCRHRSMRN